MKRVAFHAAATALLCLLAAPASAALVSSAAHGGTGTFGVSAADLANMGQPTFGSIALTSGTADFLSTPGALVEGTMYAGGPAGNTDGDRSLTPSNGAVLVLELNTGINPGGYDISSIRTYTGTAQSRSGQAYDVAISNVAAPDTFLPLYSVTGALPNNIDIGTGEVRVITQETAGNMLLGSGVAKLQFTFHDCCPGSTVDQSMFREIDVFGLATGAPTPVFAQADLVDTSQILPPGPGGELFAAVNFIYPQAQPGVLAPGTVNGIAFQNIAWNNGAPQALDEGGQITITPVLGARERFQITSATINGPDDLVLESIANTINFLGTGEQVSTNLSGLPADTAVRVQVIGGDAGTNFANWLGDLEITANGALVGLWDTVADDLNTTASLATFLAMTDAAGNLNLTFNQINPPPGQFAAIAGLIVTTAPAGAAVPEPATLGLMGLAGLALLRRRRAA